MDVIHDCMALTGRHPVIPLWEGCGAGAARTLEAVQPCVLKIVSPHRRRMVSSQELALVGMTAGSTLIAPVDSRSPPDAAVPRGAIPLLVSAGLVAAAGIGTVAMESVGPLSIRMIEHLAVMSVLAPLAAIVFGRSLPPVITRSSALLVAAAVQIVLLWLWHAPPIQRAAADSIASSLLFNAVLGLSAWNFWSAVLRCATAGNWTAIGGLLLTGKLACLLGALLIFAPRDLFGLPAQAALICSGGPSSLADQQLAGLLMITACPLSYLVAGVGLAAQMIAGIGCRHGRAAHS